MHCNRTKSRYVPILRNSEMFSPETGGPRQYSKSISVFGCTQRVYKQQLDFDIYLSLLNSLSRI